MAVVREPAPAAQVVAVVDAAPTAPRPLCAAAVKSQAPGQQRQQHTADRHEAPARHDPAPAPAHLYLAAKGVALTVPAKIGLTPPRQPAAQAPALNAPAAPARTVKVTTQPAHGTLTMIAGGGFTYTPAAGFTGTDTFAYTITTVTPAPTTPPATPTTPPATGAAAEVQIGGGPGAAVATTTTTPPGTVTLVVK